MIVRLIIFGILAYLLYRIVKGAIFPKAKINRGSAQRVVDEMVQDPFCKTYVPRRESVRRVIQGKELFFCSDECAGKYKSQLKR
jgi:YHS domain-containing protein